MVQYFIASLFAAVVEIVEVLSFQLFPFRLVSVKMSFFNSKNFIQLKIPALIQ